MGLFDSADDAKEELDQYLSGIGRDRRKSVVLSVVKDVRNTLRAIMILESSPFPMKNFVEDAEGAAHLKRVLTKGEYKAWLSLVAKVQAAGEDKVEEKLYQKMQRKSAAEQVIDQLA
jgi:hypothetical protein